MDIGLVVIGRNEGERLRRCLQSALGKAAHAVYVDSGSTDGSAAMARSMGIEVVDLDTSIPFTAARARNAGVEQLLKIAPQTPLIQFVDGDCEIDAQWWDVARQRLEAEPQLAVVCGRRRERFPEQSLYNRLCDIEWNTPVGETEACGGDSLVRVEAFQQVGGFNPALIAGEEPELCLRMRQKGWKIERIDAEMTLHDAAMTRFSMWWRREKRSGYATAEGAAMYGNLPERYRVHMHRSNWLWGLIIPLLAIAPAWWSGGWSLVLLLSYPLQWVRVYYNVQPIRRLEPPQARLFASWCLLGKFPQMLGQLKYWLGRIFHRPSRLIEYKDSPPPSMTATAKG